MFYFFFFLGELSFYCRPKAKLVFFCAMRKIHFFPPYGYIQLS